MGRNKRRRNNNYTQKSSKVIRCTLHTKPVLEHEVCSSFSPQDSSGSRKNCEHCENSL